jgi:mRNA interferase HigB
MNVIRLKTLREFWEATKDQKAKTVLTDWYWVCKAAKWKSFADLRQTFRHADQVPVPSGKTATVFNVGGNDYRVIAVVWYEKQAMKITHVLTHREYDKNTWKDQI